MKRDIRILIESIQKTYDELDDIRYRILLGEDDDDDLRCILDNMDSQAATDVYRWLKRRTKMTRNPRYEKFCKDYESLFSFNRSKEMLKWDRKW